MKFRWGLTATLLTFLCAITPSHAQMPEVIAMKCAKFEDQVKQHADSIHKARRKKAKQTPDISQSAKDAEQLAYTLATSFNMTSHNSAYVALGLCTMQKGRVN